MFNTYRNFLFSTAIILIIVLITFYFNYSKNYFAQHIYSINLNPNKCNSKYKLFLDFKNHLTFIIYLFKLIHTYKWDL